LGLGLYFSLVYICDISDALKGEETDPDGSCKGESGRRQKRENRPKKMQSKSEIFEEKQRKKQKKNE
jgi:hypothetical protein